MKAIAAIAALAAFGTANAAIITQWDFNGTSTTTVPGGINSPTPATGTGTASLLNGVVGSFASGTANGGSSDPVLTTPNNYGWGTTTYQAQGAGNGTAGVMFMVSTVGYDSIQVKFDTRHSNTSSRFIRMDYTVDNGANWVLGTQANGRIYKGDAGDTWFNLRSADLSADTSVDNNANFGVRMVTVFGPSTGDFDDSQTYTAYAASNGTSTYAATGTHRYDMVTISGNVVPEPASLAALTLGLSAIASRRRKRA